MIAAAHYVRDNPATSLFASMAALVAYFVAGDVVDVLEYYLLPYKDVLLSSLRKQHYLRRVIYSIHVALMHRVQGVELIGNLSLYMYMNSPTGLIAQQRLGGVLSYNTVRSRIARIVDGRQSSVWTHLAALLDQPVAIILLIDDFQRTLRNKAALRRQMLTDRDAPLSHSNATKIYGVGRPGTNCRVDIDRDIPLLQLDLQANLVHARSLFRRAGWVSILVSMQSGTPTDAAVGARSVSNFRLLNMTPAPVRSIFDVVDALLEFRTALDGARSQAAFGMNRAVPLFLCADFPIFRSYAQLVFLLLPHRADLTVPDILTEMFPGAALRPEAVEKLRRVRDLLATAVPLPAQFHMQQSIVKGVYFAGFRLLFRPVAKAVTRKKSLTADLPYAVVEQQLRLILHACSDLSFREQLARNVAKSPDPWPLFLQHYVQEMMPMALHVQDAFRGGSDSMVQLEIYLAHLLLGFAEIGKWHYRNCVVYLLSQLAHFKKHQPSVYSYLGRKFGDLNEVTIEYYHAHVCTFTTPGSSPVEVGKHAVVVDDLCDDLNEVKKYLFGGVKTKFRASMKFNPEDVLVRTEVEAINVALAEILRHVELTARSGSLPREFLLHVVMSSRGELLYRSEVFEFVECRLLGLPSYVPHCAVLCAVCLSQLAQLRPSSACMAPMCAACASSHSCLDDCRVRPDYFPTAHLCACCDAPVFTDCAKIALQAAAASTTARGARFGCCCAHILCALCADSAPSSDPCPRCALLADECFADAVERANSLFMPAANRTLRETLRRLVVAHGPAGASELDGDNGDDDEEVDQLYVDASPAASFETVCAGSIGTDLIPEMTSSGAGAAEAASAAAPASIDDRVAHMKLSGAAKVKKVVSMYNGSFPGSRYIPQARRWISISRARSNAPRRRQSAAGAAAAAAAGAASDNE